MAICVIRFRQSTICIRLIYIVIPLVPQAVTRNVQVRVNNYPCPSIKERAWLQTRHTNLISQTFSYRTCFLCVQFQVFIIFSLFFLDSSVRRLPSVLLNDKTVSEMFPFSTFQAFLQPCRHLSRDTSAAKNISRQPVEHFIRIEDPLQATICSGFWKDRTYIFLRC